MGDGGGAAGPALLLSAGAVCLSLQEVSDHRALPADYWPLCGTEEISQALIMSLSRDCVNLERISLLEELCKLQLKCFLKDFLCFE